jgi:hypothetical protein
MTDDMMDLQALLGKSGDADFLREMIGFAAQRLMDLKVGGMINPALPEDRRGYAGEATPRHGTRPNPVSGDP